MEVKVDDFQIKIFEDFYSINSTDNLNEYDFVYLDEKEQYEYATVLGIKIYQSDFLLKSAIIGGVGGATGIHKTGFIAEAGRLTICCSDTVFCLPIPDLVLLWKTKADMGCCFEIFKYQNDYIIHGELEITRLANDGRIMWQQGGAEIFTTVNPRQDDFLITEHYILATDWNNRKYKFDFDGNEIRRGLFSYFRQACHSIRIIFRKCIPSRI